MRRPAFTDRIARGFAVIYPVVEVALEMPSESDFETCTDAELSDAAVAMEYLAKMTLWAEARRGTP